MAHWYPARQILGLPAWLWVVLAIPLFFLANPQILKVDVITPVLALQSQSSWLAEPPDSAAIAREQIIVAREGDSFRFVPADEKGEKEPLWRVFVELVDHQENLSGEASYFLPGLIHRESRWTYVLKAYRVDYGFRMELREHRFRWKADKENPYELPPQQIRKVKPIVVAEFNRRHPTMKLGDRLKRMLDDGLEASSTSFAPQNALILLRWLALLIALVGLCSMFVRPAVVPVYPREAGYLTILIAYVRRWRRRTHVGKRAPVEIPPRGL